LAASSLTGAGTLAANLTVTSSIVYDADAQAFFDRVTTAGGTLSATEQNAVNTLVIALKADGIWTKMKAIYPMVGASAAACSRNLKSNNFNGTFSSGWTFASTGVTPNGTSAYFDTTLPNNTMSQNSNCFGVYIRTTSIKTSSDIAVYNITFGSNIYTNAIPGITGAFNNGNNLALANFSNYVGFFLNKRTTSTQIVLQKDSVQTTISNNSVNLITSNFILSRTGNADAEYSNRQNAFAFIGDGLTDTEAANFYTRVQDFQTTLSRQV
jgi:hypothetical protein